MGRKKKNFKNFLGYATWLTQKKTIRDGELKQQFLDPLEFSTTDIIVRSDGEYIYGECGDYSGDVVDYFKIKYSASQNKIINWEDILHLPVIRN